MKHMSIGLIAFLFGIGLCIADENAWAALPLLGELHRSEDISCADCHDEDPPAKPVSMARCLECHESYDRLAEQTRKTDPNPHHHHEGGLDCNQCHHMHKSSVDYCQECHSWGYKVP